MSCIETNSMMYRTDTDLPIHHYAVFCLLHVDFAKFLGDLSRWSLQEGSNNQKMRPPQELIDVGLLDTTGWVDLAIPTKNNVGFLGAQMLPKCPPFHIPDTCRVLHAPCIALISCDWSSTKIASLLLQQSLCFRIPKQ